jgi:transcriptional regulator with XRE-family HTH domain
MAAKLHMAVSGYAKIERGETDIPFSRLEQIAKTFEIDLTSLIGMNERNVFNLVNSPEAHAHANTHSTVNVYSCEAAKFQHENEKLLLVLEQKDKQIDSLQQQVSDLREIISLLKNTDPS